MDEQTLLQQFEARSLPLQDWHHRQHLTVAYLYLQQYGLEDALDRIRKGIIAYNTAHNVQDTLTSGYHETMTQAWVRLVHFTMNQSTTAESAAQFLDENPQLLEKRVLRFFYSRQRLVSAEAKRSYVPPDLTNFPINPPKLPD
jgi:hypothetical protein